MQDGRLNRRRGERGMTRRAQRGMTRRAQRGMTLVELIVAVTIMALLTTMAVPLARGKVRRDQERQLADALREMRKAIDDYKDAALAGKIQTKVGTDGYPEKLQDLVEGVNLVQSAESKKIKFLRRIPFDPITKSYDWGLHSMEDDPKSTSWGGQNVFDVYCKSTEMALDGKPYSEK